VKKLAGILAGVLGSALLAGGPVLAGGDSPAAAPKAAPPDPFKVHSQIIIPELNSGDAEQVKAGLDDLSNWLKADSSDREEILGLLVQTKHFADLDDLARKMILADPSDSGQIGQVEAVIVRSYIAQKKPQEALSAARVYYNICPLYDTSRAISLVSLCLAKARPDQAGLIRRFKKQQIEGGNAQPAPGPASQPAQADNILLGIPIDPKPWAKAIDDITTDDFKSYVAKGNLLLLAGRTKEALENFKQAYEIAEDDQSAEAVENEARALRADSGTVGPANAFITRVRNGQE
jgi:tetratricopeptide (TPR) repeat protein